MGLWKDFTGIVKNVLGIKAGKNVYIAATNNYKNISPVYDDGIDYDGAYNGGTLGASYSNNIEAGTLRTDLVRDHSYGINGVRSSADVYSINSGFSNFSSKMLQPYEMLGELGANTEWTVATRFDARTLVPMVSGIIQTNALHPILEVGKVYLYLGEDNVSIPVYPYRITDRSSTLTKGDLVFMVEEVAANLSFLNSCVPLSRHLSTTFTTASDLGTPVVDAANSSYILNPGAAGADAYTLTPNAVYANDSSFVVHGRGAIKWVRKTPEFVAGDSSLSSGVLVINMNAAIGVKTSVNIPAGCCVTGVSAKVGSVFTGSWELALSCNSTSYPLLHSTEVANTANTESQKDDLFVVSDMDAYPTYLDITGRTTVNLYVYVKYEPLYVAV